MFQPYTEEKVWGSVQHIFGSEHAGVSCLTVKAGTNCSIHYHVYRGNLFNVLEGSVLIEEFGPFPANSNSPNLDNVDRTLLSPGDTYKVNPLIWHRFRVVQSGRMVEVYWPAAGEVDQSDIIRHNQGTLDDLPLIREIIRREEL